MHLDFETSRFILRFQRCEIDYENPGYNEAKIVFEKVSNFAFCSPNEENTIKDMWDLEILSGEFWMEKNLPKAKVELTSVDSKYYLVLIFSFQNASIELSKNESYAN